GVGGGVAVHWGRQPPAGRLHGVGGGHGGGGWRHVQRAAGVGLSGVGCDGGRWGLGFLCGHVLDGRVVGVGGVGGRLRGVVGVGGVGVVGREFRWVGFDGGGPGREPVDHDRFVEAAPRRLHAVDGFGDIVVVRVC